MKKYEHLFFDLDNTLWDFDTNSRLALQQTVQELNLNKHIASFDDFFLYYEKVNQHLWEAYRNKLIKKHELITQRFKQTLDHFNLDGVDPLDINHCYLQLMPLQKRLFPNVLETLDYLKNKRYQMHIITNGFTEVQHKKIKSSGLSTYFKWIFISEEIKAPKPDKRIFQHALKCCNAKKNKSIMIGDSWESDILGARNVGLDQVVVVNKSNYRTVPPRDKWGVENTVFFERKHSTVSTFTIEKLELLTKMF